MHIKQTKMICSVQGCRNTDTVFASRNGVCVNTPNLCRECIKNIYEAVFDVIETPKMSVADTAESLPNAYVTPANVRENAENARKSAENAGKSQPKLTAKSRGGSR